MGICIQIHLNGIFNSETQDTNLGGRMSPDGEMKIIWYRVFNGKHI